MASTYQATFVRRDSGVDTVDSIKTTEPYECAAAGGSAPSDSTVDRICYNNNYNPSAMKRTLSNASSGWSEASGGTAKKCRYNKKSNNKVVSTTQVLRMLCPFFIDRLSMAEHKASCHLTGFDGMARLKQHLVKEHQVPKEDLNYFKDKSFRDLGTLEANGVECFARCCPIYWKRIFPRLVRACVEMRYTALLMNSILSHTWVFLRRRARVQQPLSA